MTRPFRAALRAAAASSVLFSASVGVVVTTISPARATVSAGDPAAGASAVPVAPAGPVTVPASTAALATSALSQTSRYILQFGPSTDATAEATVHSQRGMAVQSVLTNVFSGEIADLSASQVKALRLNPKVRSIEADTPVQAEASPSTVTQSPVTWGLDRIDQRANTPSNSYSYDTTGTGVKAYVVDSGILATHTDFGGRVTSGANAYTGVRDSRGTNDCDGHGTHVAGIIGGRVYGVAKEVTLVPVRVLDCNGGGTASGIINGLNWIIGNHPAGAPAVANLSLGLDRSDLVDEAVRATIADGVSMVVAAGNSNRNSCERSPSRVAEAVTVGAIDSSDRRAYFSNFGSCVDLFAPGVSITSDWKNDGIPANKNRSTMIVSGTSMATPHVAGTAALILGVTPTRVPADVSADLKTLATAGVVSNSGEGSPNLLLNTGATPPPITEPPVAPTAVSATTPTNATTTVTWLPSTSPSILDQTVNIYRDGTLLRSTVVASVTKTMIYDSMTTGASYTFTVQARNTIGLSTASSPSEPVAWRTVPSIPTSVTASVDPTGTASVTWSVASNGGSSLTEQTVRTYRSSGRSFELMATTSLSGSATGFTTATPLEAGIAYKFTVQARNTIGTSSASAYSNTVTRITAPAPPTEVQASLNSQSRAVIVWAKGSTGGSALSEQSITLYANGIVVSSFSVNASARTATTPAALPIGVRYTFTVKAKNAVGWSTESNRSNAVTRLR